MKKLAEEIQHNVALVDAATYGLQMYSKVDVDDSKTYGDLWAYALKMTEKGKVPQGKLSKADNRIFEEISYVNMMSELEEISLNKLQGGIEYIKVHSMDVYEMLLQLKKDYEDAIKVQDFWLETAELVSFMVQDSWLETAELDWLRFSRSGSLIQNWLVSIHWLVSGQDWLLVSFLVLFLDWLLDRTGSDSADLVHWLVSGLVTGSGPSAGTQGSATQDPHIAASDSSSDLDVMEGYPMQQHPESSSQDMHALGQQPGISIFSRLKKTLSRATRSEHATNEINKGGGEVDSLFTSQIDPVLSESAHVSTPATTPIGLSKLTPSETLLPDGRSLAKVQEVERYILAAREKKIKSLRKAEQRRATLAKAPMTSANPLQSPELTTLTSQPIGSHIASGSKDTLNTSILDGVFLNENWEYNLQTEKLTDLYTSYTYHVGWLDVIQATSNSTSVDEQQRMICDVIHSIVQMERQNLGINMPSMGPMRFLDTTKAKQPTITQMETPSVSPMDPSYIVSPGVSMQSEPTHGSFSFSDLMQLSLGDLPTPTMNMTGGAPSTLLAGTTPLHTSVAPLPILIGVHQPYVPIATHPYVAPMPPLNPTAYVPQSHYPSPYFSGAVPAGINTSYPTSAIPEPTSTSFRPSLGAVPYEVLRGAKESTPYTAMTI
ncbi:hypothetical protein L7F22_007719 [Adiantum nelumboides]|nr:hypothetical protein [Adiantum nelumboides]